MFGRRVVNIGDKDGDGNDDLAVSAPLAYSSDGRTGSVLILSGRTGHLIHRIDGIKNRERLGWEMTLLKVSSNPASEYLIVSDIDCTAQSDCVPQQNFFSTADWRLATVIQGGLGGLFSIGDINSDGFSEFLVHSHLKDEMIWYSGKSLKQLATATIAGWPRVLEEDYDDDGILDLLSKETDVQEELNVVSSRTGKKISSLKCGHHNYLPFWSSLAIPVVSDGKRGILLDLSWPSDSTSQLAVFSGVTGKCFKKTSVTQPSKPSTFGKTYTPFAVPDVDGDGQYDIVTLSGEDYQEEVSAWSGKSLAPIWSVKGVVQGETITLAPLQGRLPDRSTALELAVGSCRYVMDGEEFGKNGSIALLDAKSGKELRRYREADYPEVGHLNFLKSRGNVDKK